ncbi:sulfotransferase family protein [Nonomuraea sp. NPDC051941]|uniref:sulfotransferase family protein n=1 Tax=Nonomuraea sp. NPDC051941 TaxID=3364373 RepID=UPI0037C91F52
MGDHSSGKSGMVRGKPANSASAEPGPVAAEHAADRLLRAPVVVLAPPRSGSTLLRLILGSHSQLHAPHETHLGQITVSVPLGPAAVAMRLLGHDQAALEHLLWDRLLHLDLVRAGKPTLVIKSPADTLIWSRLADCWHDARFVFLLRHPAAILRSWCEATGLPAEPSAGHLASYMAAVEEARRHLPGVTVTYEQLVADPAAQVGLLCDHLGVAFEPGMLNYGRHPHGPLVRGVGDWLDKIRTGRPQPARPAPAVVPAELAGVAAAWGYTAATPG